MMQFQWQWHNDISIGAGENADNIDQHGNEGMDEARGNDEDGHNVFKGAG